MQLMVCNMQCTYSHTHVGTFIHFQGSASLSDTWLACIATASTPISIVRLSSASLYPSICHSASHNLLPLVTAHSILHLFPVYITTAAILADLQSWIHFDDLNNVWMQAVSEKNSLWYIRMYLYLNLTLKILTLRKKKDPFFPFTWMTLNFSDPEMLVFSETIIETRWFKQLVFLTIPKARHP